jgi:1,4-alpha-glucan branching enzyme
LADFDRSMMALDRDFGVLDCAWPEKRYEHADDSVLAFERGGLLFVFNLHPTNSYARRAIPCPAGEYSMVLNSDAETFGGCGRIDQTLKYSTQSGDSCLHLYLPSRTAVVLRAISSES